MTIQTGMPWLTLLATSSSSPFRHAAPFPSFLRDLSRNPKHTNSSSTRSFKRNLSANNGFPLKACGNDAVGVLHSHARIHTPSPNRHAVLSPSFLRDLSRNPQHTNATSTRSFKRNFSTNNGFPLRTCGNDAVGVLHSHARVQTPSLNRHAVLSPSFLRDLSRNPQHNNSSSTRSFSRNLSPNNGFPLRACGNDGAEVFYGK